MPLRQVSSFCHTPSVITIRTSNDLAHTEYDRPISRPGFTLIELLVVVSIIGLLISLLLPSLKKARHQAKSVMCLANIKGIASASLTYAAEDPQENSIPVHALFDQGGDPGAYDWGGKAGRGDASEPMDSPFSTPMGRGPASRPLNELVFKERFTDYLSTPGVNQSNWTTDQTLDLPIYRCPSDRGYTGHHYTTWAVSRLSSYDHYGTSYAGNSLTSNTLFHAHTAGTVTISYTPYFRPLSRIPVPAETVYYLENCGRFAWHVDVGFEEHPDDFDCFGYGFGGVWNVAVQPAHVNGWHGRAFYIATSYTDGHAGMTEMNGRGVPAPGWASWNAVSRGRGWNVAESNFGFTEYRSCSWIRGHGWRIDTHPLPTVLLPSPVLLTPLAAEIR